jgi:hypothetical protein
MTPFQWLALALLSLLLVREGVRLGRGLGWRWFTLLRAAVWASAAATIADPNLTQWVAEALGIGLGANLVLYVFVLAYLGTTFFLYARYLQVQQQLTALVRHLAIQEARKGSGQTARDGEGPLSDTS